MGEAMSIMNHRLNKLLNDPTASADAFTVYECIVRLHTDVDHDMGINVVILSVLSGMKVSRALAACYELEEMGYLQNVASSAGGCGND